MKRLALVALLVFVLVSPVLGDELNEPARLSFVGSQWWDNPVQIVENSSGWIGTYNTSSRDIEAPGGELIIRVEPEGGITDMANNPDYAWVAMIEYCGEHPIGYIAISFLGACVLSSIVRKRKWN